MRYALVIGTAAPAIAAAAALLWREPLRAMGPELGPRAIAALGIVTSIGASVWIALSTAREAMTPTGGFEADPWRALIAISIGAGALAWLVRRREALDVLVARLGLSATLIGSVYAADGATVGIFIAVASSCVLWLAVRGHIGGRTTAVLVVTDVVMLASIWVRSAGGLGTPMQMDGAASWLWLACILARASIWARTDEPGLALGYMMQGLWFAYWIVGDDSRAALAIAAAALAVIGARRLARLGSPIAPAMTFAMLGAIAIASADAGLSGAVVVLAAATGVAGVLAALGRSGGVLSALVPTGAAFPGIVLLATVSLRDQDSPGRLVAIGVCVAAAYLAAAGSDTLRDPRVRARAGWALIPVAAGVAIAAAPRAIADAFAPGSGTLTSVVWPLPEWFVPAAAVAIIAASWGTHASIGEHIEGPDVVEASWSVRRVHLVAAAAVVMAAVALVLRGISRGFL